MTITRGKTILRNGLYLLMKRCWDSGNATKEIQVMKVSRERKRATWGKLMPVQSMGNSKVLLDSWGNMKVMDAWLRDLEMRMGEAVDVALVLFLPRSVDKIIPFRYCSIAGLPSITRTFVGCPCYHRLRRRMIAPV